MTELRHGHFTKLSQELLFCSHELDFSLAIMPCGCHLASMEGWNILGYNLVPLWRADSCLVDVLYWVNTWLYGRQVHYLNLSRRSCLIWHLFLSLQISIHDALTAQHVVCLLRITIPVPVVCLKTDFKSWNSQCCRHRSRPDLFVGTNKLNPEILSSLNWGKFFGFSVHQSGSMLLTTVMAAFPLLLVTLLMGGVLSHWPKSLRSNRIRKRLACFLQNYNCKTFSLWLPTAWVA